MTTLAVSSDVANAVRLRWPDRSVHWLAEAPGELAAICTRYRATPVAVLPARYGFVVAADTPTGQLVVRSSPDPDAPAQAAVAERLAELGVAPVLYEVLQTDSGTWTVMERVTPGSSFSDAPATPQSLSSLARTVEPMIGQPSPAVELMPLTSWLEDRLTDDNLADLPPGRSPAPPGDRAAALALLQELSPQAPGLCHGDLSPGNVLHDSDGRFYFIDPRGLSGTVEYDLAVLASKAPQHGSREAVAERLAKACGLDPDIIGSWLTVSLAARV